MNDSSIIYKKRINRVIDHINGHLNEPFSLESLAGIACYSPYHFHRVFTAVTGETVNYFTNRLRNEKAARLLKFSTESISEISSACGYSSPATLSRAFKQYFGLSPSAYRKSGEIQNSKIRKDLFPVDTYHCTEEDEVLETKFPVEIRKLPERRIAYIRVTNAFKEGAVISAFGQLIEWAKAHQVYETGTIFGMSIDDPEVTPKARDRYEACIAIPKDLKVGVHPLIGTMTLPGCRYAVTGVKVI